VDVALAYMGLGDVDTAFQWLDQGFDVKSVDLIRVAYHPMWEPLWSDPRHQALLERIGLS
jgi:hypothetical protein